MLSYMRRLTGGNGAGETTGERNVSSQLPSGAGTNWATATALAGATAERATQAAAHVAGAAKAVATVPKDLVTGAVRRGVEGATRRLRALIEKFVQIASFFSAAASLLVTGLFLSIGSEFASVIDRASVLTSIVLLAGTFTVLRVVINVLPALAAQPDQQPAASAAPPSGRGRVLQSAVNGIVVVAFVIAIIGLIYGVAFLLLLVLGWAVFRRRNLTAQLSAALIACLCLGYLRGEHLRDQQPALLLVEQGKPTPGAVTVIMAADRGVLVFADGADNARFVPWDKVESLSDPRPSRWRLRDAIAPVRAWIEGGARSMWK